MEEYLKAMKKLLDNIKNNPLVTTMDDLLVKFPPEDKCIQLFVKYDLKEKYLLQPNAAKLNAIQPYQRPYKDSLLTIYKYKKQLDYRKSQLKEPGCSIRSSFIASKQHSSLANLNDLKPILLKDMKVNQIHQGYYLECKTVSESFYVVGICFLVEDKSGDVENVMLYNYNAQTYELDLNVLIPSGSRLLIKEPYLKLITTGKDEFGIRIDSPTDFIILNKEADATKTVEKLVDEGNLLFQKGQYHPAILLYTQAVQKSKNQNIRALLNRSQAYLKLDRYHSAYLDAQQAAELDKSNEKALFRMGKAAYSMRQFDKARENFETCLKIKNVKEAEIELSKANDRLNESKTGIYDFKTILEQYLTKENLNFDIAEFKSSKIAVADIPNKSKGVIAIENIKKGTLLVVSKAVSAYFQKKTPENYLIKVDFTRDNCDLNDGVENLTNIVYRMQSNPELAKQVYSLFAGPSYKRDDIINENVIDIARLDGIQRYNTFGIEKDFDLIELEMETLFECESGLWIFPAFFNHSCIGSVIRLFLGDILLIYAKRDIKKGEEITVKYFSGDFKQRNEMAQKIHHFKCDCQLCRLDESDANLERRATFLEELKAKASNLSQLSLKEAQRDVKLMRKLYLDRTEFQNDLVVPLQNLAFKQREKLNYKESAKLFEEVYEITKERASLVAIDSLKEAYKDYNNCSLTDKSKWCYQTALEYFGDNKIFFERFWGTA